MPNLSQLTVVFRDPHPYEGSWLYLSDLSALQPLGAKLQQLAISSSTLSPHTGHDFLFLSSLIGLTNLRLPICTTNGFEALSALTNLRSLALCADADPDAAPFVVPTSHDLVHAALAQLSHLVALELWQVEVDAPHAFLTGLTLLTLLDCAVRDDEALAGLSAAPQLRYLQLHYTIAAAPAEDIAQGSQESRGCTAAGLLQSLTALTALTRLELEQSGNLSEDEWRDMLRGLRHVKEVSVRISGTMLSGDVDPAIHAWRSLDTHKPAAVMFQSC